MMAALKAGTEAERRRWLLEPSLTTEAERRRWLLEPSLTVGMMSERAARERYGLPSLRETIALESARAIERCGWTSVAAPFAHHDGPKLRAALITLGAPLTAAVRGLAISILLDSETPKDLQEAIGWFLAWAPTPAWSTPATTRRQARARLDALFRGLVDARTPQPRLRLGAAVVGQRMAATALPAADRERWFWQRVKGYLTGRVHERPVVVRPLITGGEAAIEHLLRITLPSDPEWPEELTPLLGEVTREHLPEIPPAVRRRMMTSLLAKLATRAN
jgi:hypothetical protein